MAYIFLIQTLGGSPEPLAHSLCQHRPERVRFIVSPQSQPLARNVVARAEENGFWLGPGSYDLLEIGDAEAFDTCLEAIARLGDEVRRWVARGEESGTGAEGENPYRVVVDFTGGTKAMSAAAVVASLRWPCSHAYVGGARRDREGLGTVITGTESVRHDSPRLHTFLERDRYALLFDSEEFDAAARSAAAMRNRLTGSEKQEWQALYSLAEAYRAWDRFEYRKAGEALEHALCGNNHFRQWPGEAAGRRLAATLEEHRGRVAGLRPEASAALIADLAANARRCARRGRWDDATARLYRAVEMGAQVRLQSLGVHPGRVRPADLPPALQGDPWLCPPGEAAPRWGLRAAYHALRLLEDPLGAHFEERFGKAGTPSALETRNDSLLAHGCAPISEKGYRDLWEAAVALLEIDPAKLVTFPRIYAESER